MVPECLARESPQSDQPHRAPLDVRLDVALAVLSEVLLGDLQEILRGGVRVLVDWCLPRAECGIVEVRREGLDVRRVA